MLLASSVSANNLSAPVVSPPTIDELIVQKASEYQVSEALMREIIHCESSGNPNAIGDNGQSFGLVQIHLPSWPDISEEQALNPDFATTFLAEKLSKGQGYLWTCHRMIMGTN